MPNTGLHGTKVLILILIMVMIIYLNTALVSDVKVGNGCKEMKDEKPYHDKQCFSDIFTRVTGFSKRFLS